MRHYKGSTRAYRKARAQILAYSDLCWICDQPARPNDPLVVDHVWPRALGGGDHISNLRAAHRTCNSKKRDKPPNEIFARWA